MKWAKKVSMVFFFAQTGDCAGYVVPPHCGRVGRIGYFVGLIEWKYFEMSLNVHKTVSLYPSYTRSLKSHKNKIKL
jgi:hypothetical protein